MENSNCSEHKRRKSNTLENHSSKAPSGIIVVGVKLHSASDYANTAQAVQGQPAKDASSPMLPENECDGLDKEGVYDEGSYDKRFRVGDSSWEHCSHV